MPNKFEQFHDSKPQVKKSAVHPVWRGIGCLMMLIIPVVAYAGAVMLVEANSRQGWVPVGRELSQTVAVPGLGAVPYLYANLIVAVILSLVGFALLTVFFAVFTRMAAPPPPTFDVPPVRRQSRRNY